MYFDDKSDISKKVPFNKKIRINVKNKDIQPKIYQFNEFESNRKTIF